MSSRSLYGLSWCLVKAGLWLASLGGWQLQIPVPCARPHVDAVASAVQARARTLVLLEEAEKPRVGAGENKRHRVYARLLKEFPAVRKSDVGLAIELAVRGLEAL